MPASLAVPLSRCPLSLAVLLSRSLLSHSDSSLPPFLPPSVRRGVFLTDEHLGNADALSRHAGSIPVFELPALPPPELPLEPWYDSGDTARGFQGLLGGLAGRRVADVARLAGMKARGHRALWWPFTQHDDLSEGKVNLLDSAYGDYFCVADVEDGQDGGGGGEGGAEVRRENQENEILDWSSVAVQF